MVTGYVICSLTGRLKLCGESKFFRSHFIVAFCGMLLLSDDEQMSGRSTAGCHATQAVQYGHRVGVLADEN